MSLAAAFVLGFSFMFGSLLIGRALREIALAIHMSRTRIDLGPLVAEFRRWMRVHYAKERP